MAVLVAVACIGAACGNAEDGDGAAGEEAAEAVAVDAPGVTDTEIRVGGVASVTNPVDARFGDSFAGAEAYFEMVNEEGGVHGRTIELVATHDDETANNATVVRQLLDEDVFAVLPVATVLFSGAQDLVDAGVPTFGWALNPEWEGTEGEPRENLFGQAGSFICFDCPKPEVAYAAELAGATDIGLLAYNVPQSAQCAAGVEASLEQYAAGERRVAFADTALAFGATDLSAQVSRMKDEGVDMVMTCMDAQGVVTLAREMNRQSLDAVQYLVNFYDHGLLAEYSDLLQGSYVLTNFVPFEVEEPPPGLERFLDRMEASGTEPTENSMAGWLNAALFVEGLREAGPDFSRQAVVDAINGMTDWDADGILPGVDWTTAHTQPPQPSCVVLSRVEGDAFVPATGEPGRPFACLDREAQGMPEPVPSD